MSTGSEVLEARSAPRGGAPFDVDRVRADFPILGERVRGKPLVFLDSAASSQKPACVIEALERYYRSEHANVHRGVYQLSERATAKFEGARETVRRFLNAASVHEIVFTRGTTEAINLVAQSYGRRHVREGDEVLITWMEHHSNIVPWQLLCEEKGAALRVVPMDDAGVLRMDDFERLLGPKTRIVAVGHVSNALGTVNPVRRIVELAHAQGVPVLVDGAQAAPHVRVDVKELGCDFYAFSGHKAYAPTGIGVLYGREDLLEEMPPYQGGGDMIRSVSFEKTLFNTLPYKFEAGTPHISGAIGLGVALDYLAGLQLLGAREHEERVLEYGTRRLSELSGLRLVGTAPEKVGVLSFVLDCAHPHDVGTILDGEGVAVRTGHHCAQPVMERLGIPATVRASLGVYNDERDIDALVAALGKVVEVFG